MNPGVMAYRMSLDVSVLLKQTMKMIERVSTFNLIDEVIDNQHLLFM